MIDYDNQQLLLCIPNADLAVPVVYSSASTGGTREMNASTCE